MNPTLEKVARAIADANEEDFDATPSLYLALALTALTALLPPSEEMVEAMHQSLRQGVGCLIHPHDLAAAFTAAIQEALKVGEG